VPRRTLQMAFRLTSVVLGIAAAGALIGALLFGMRPEAQEPATPKDDVTPAELQLYIDVYTTMQADHDLTLDQVLATKNVSLVELSNNVGVKIGPAATMTARTGTSIEAPVRVST